MRSYRLFVFFIFGCACCTTISAQDKKETPAQLAADSLDRQKFHFLINANREQSYITVTDGVGNLEPLIMETKLSPSYFFSQKKKTWAILLNPQVQIRMQNKESFPISTPTYKAHLTFFHSIDFWNRSAFLKRLFYENALWSVSLGHHSNGKAGSFYVGDTTNTIDFENGNFATNYFMANISTYKVKKVMKTMVAYRLLKASTEIHPPSWSPVEIRRIYGNYRFFGAVGFGGPWREAKKTWLNNWLQHSSFELQLGWIAGRMDGASPVEASKRLIVDMHYQYYPPWFDEIAFFVRYYRGQDYYNVYFINNIYVLSFGLTSNILNMQQAARFIGNKK
jgi:hypothetical protein